MQYFMFAFDTILFMDAIFCTNISSVGQDLNNNITVQNTEYLTSEIQHINTIYIFFKYDSLGLEKNWKLILFLMSRRFKRTGFIKLD